MNDMIFKGLFTCDDREGKSGTFNKFHCWLVRVSLFIEIGGAEDLRKGWRGAFSTFMINRPILHGSDWWKFRFQNMVMGCIQSSFSM